MVLCKLGCSKGLHIKEWSRQFVRGESAIGNSTMAKLFWLENTYVMDKTKSGIIEESKEIFNIQILLMFIHIYRYFFVFYVYECTQIF